MRALLSSLILTLGCAKAETPRAETPPAAPHAIAAARPAPSPSAAHEASEPPPAASASKIDTTTHPWLASPAADQPAAVDTLEARFAPPKGFVRELLPEGSFGAFLRTLPLAAAGAPVLTHTGKVLYASHPNIAAVVAIDVGKGDLQQCADSVIRMHAEWMFGRGRRDMHYKSASGLVISYDKYVSGERLSLDGQKLVSKKVAKPGNADHASFRAWLDDVFGWANTGSLAKEAKPIGVSELRAGDFVVLPGVPFGHAVLILDVARDDKGNKKLLLGQGYMPAQSFHVLRPSETETWFTLDVESGQLKTPFWDPFPFSALRRLDG